MRMIALYVLLFAVVLLRDGNCQSLIATFGDPCSYSLSQVAGGPVGCHSGGSCSPQVIADRRV